MPDVISLKELVSVQRTMLSVAILNSMVSTGKETYGIIPGDMEQEIVLDFKINGVPTSIRNFLDLLDKDIDRQIEIAAADLLRKRLKDDAYTALDNMKRMIRKTEIELFETYFPNDPEFNETRWDNP